MPNKIWKIVGKEEEYSDIELKKLISSGEISLKEKVYSEEIKEPIEIEDTIYRFYLKEKKK